jgi:hypothetical protein
LRISISLPMAGTVSAIMFKVLPTRRKRWADLKNISLKSFSLVGGSQSPKEDIDQKPPHPAATINSGLVISRTKHFRSL